MPKRSLNKSRTKSRYQTIIEDDIEEEKELQIVKPSIYYTEEEKKNKVVEVKLSGVAAKDNSQDEKKVRSMAY